MFVYKITNTINSKVYIGQSIRPIEQRFKRHINDAVNYIVDTHFARAIRKYGPESFQIELIDTAKTIEELSEKERYWIHWYKSIDSEYGYNETDAQYKCGGNTYCSKSAEEMIDIKAKIRNTKLGFKNPNAAAVKCYNVNTEQEIFFSTVKECQEYFNESTHRFISTRVSGQIQGLFRNEWKIAYANCEYADFLPMRHKHGLHLCVKDNETNQVQQFDSVRLMSRTLNVSRSEIGKHIKNKETEFEIQKYTITILD